MFPDGNTTKHSSQQPSLQRERAEPTSPHSIIRTSLALVGHDHKNKGFGHIKIHLIEVLRYRYHEIPLDPHRNAVAVPPLTSQCRIPYCPKSRTSRLTLTCSESRYRGDQESHDQPLFHPLEPSRIAGHERPSSSLVAAKRMLASSCVRASSLFLTNTRRRGSLMRPNAHDPILPPPPPIFEKQVCDVRAHWGKGNNWDDVDRGYCPIRVTGERGQGPPRSMGHNYSSQDALMFDHLLHVRLFRPCQMGSLDRPPSGTPSNSPYQCPNCRKDNMSRSNRPIVHGSC